MGTGCNRALSAVHAAPQAPVEMAASYLEASFLAMCGHYGLPLPEQQYRFAPPRRWAFDFAWPLTTSSL